MKRTEVVTLKARADAPESPVHEYKTVIVDSEDPGYVNRILVATPSTGLIRMEWALARWGQIIPVNWSQVQMVQWMNAFAPLRYQVSDAQNIIVREALEKEFEWLLLVEQDNVLPPDAFVRFNKYMREKKEPIVSGLYYTKSNPPEPLVFRGRGNSYYSDWKLGDVVRGDGVPTGCLLIHNSILKELWKEAETYELGAIATRKVFDTPRKLWYDPETGDYNTLTGTSDLDWCSKIIEHKIFEKAGWPKHQKMKYPFVIDTNIFCKHIDENGIQYP